MRDYSQRVVYLGIDVHKKTYAVTAVCDGQTVKKDTLKANPDVLLAYCRKFFPGAQIQSAYEAGFCGFHLHRHLVAGGIDSAVVHPASIEVEARNRVKTDKRDSQKIATQLATGRLKGIYVPKQEREDFRSVSRLRTTLMRERIRLGNMLKSFLHTRGLVRWEENCRISRKWMESLLKLQVESEVKFTIETYVKTWIQLSDSIENVKGRLEVQALKDFEMEEIYRSLPGVGPIASRLLINELDDMSQFPNENRLFSYCGLTPSEHSSGEHRHLGHISRQGKSELRKILVQCAWVAIKHDASLTTIFDRLQSKTGSKKAIVAIARKLVGRMYCCLKERRLYQRVTENGELVVQTETADEWIEATAPETKSILPQPLANQPTIAPAKDLQRKERPKQAKRGGLEERGRKAVLSR